MLFKNEISIDAKKFLFEKYSRENFRRGKVTKNLASDEYFSPTKIFSDEVFPDKVFCKYFYQKHLSLPWKGIFQGSKTIIDISKIMSNFLCSWPEHCLKFEENETSTNSWFIS